MKSCVLFCLVLYFKNCFLPDYIFQLGSNSSLVWRLLFLPISLSFTHPSILTCSHSRQNPSSNTLIPHFSSQQPAAPSTLYPHTSTEMRKQNILISAKVRKWRESYITRILKREAICRKFFFGNFSFSFNNLTFKDISLRT